MKSDSIVDSRMWVRLDLDTGLKANTFFQTNPSHRAHFASQMLLYDRVVIPTKDFGIVPILISWMGLSCFRDALDSGALAFVVLRSLLAYQGNGHGLCEIEIRDTPQKPFKWYQAAMFGPWDKAPELQLRYQCPFLSSAERSTIVQATLQNTRPLEWGREFFIRNIINEAYADVMGSPTLQAYLMHHERSGASQVDPARLRGVGPNQYRVLNLEEVRDGIDLVLRVAEINLEIAMSDLYGQSDLGTSVGAEHLLKDKLARAGATPSVLSSFITLLELASVPDIRPAVEAGDVSIADIWGLRNKKASREFREWMRAAQPQDARDLEKAYVASLCESAFYSSLPMRVLRFAVTTAVGAFQPIAGILTGAVDSFFIEKWLAGYSPRLFLEELRKLPQ